MGGTLGRSRLTLNPFSHVWIGKGWILFNASSDSQNVPVCDIFRGVALLTSLVKYFLLTLEQRGAVSQNACGSFGE